MEIKILGSGCKKCNKLEANVNEALKAVGLSANVEKVTDMVEITSYGVMQTPALVIDNEVISYGKLLSVKDLVKVLSK